VESTYYSKDREDLFHISILKKEVKESFVSNKSKKKYCYC
jgi:hypothetical protein